MGVPYNMEEKDPGPGKHRKLSSPTIKAGRQNSPVVGNRNPKLLLPERTGLYWEKKDKTPPLLEDRKGKGQIQKYL